MSHIRDYRITTEGGVVVRLKDGTERPADEREWIAVWLKDPVLTLAAVR